MDIPREALQIEESGVERVLVGPHERCSGCGAIYSFRVVSMDTIGATTACLATTMEYYWLCPACHHKNGPNKFLGFANPAIVMTREEYEKIMEIERTTK